MRVLAVDDDEQFLSVLTEYLEEEGHQVVAVDSGVGALDRLEFGGEPFDVVLLDLMMPRLDGWAVVSRLRSLPGLSELPVVLLTGVSDKRWLSDGLLAGANYYVRKDKAFDVLPSLLADIASNKPAEH